MQILPTTNEYRKDFDVLADFFPVVSTATNLIDIFQKAVILPWMSADSVQRNHYYRHLQNKSFLRCITLAVPTLGNVAVMVFDLISEKSIKKYVAKFPVAMPAMMLNILGASAIAIKIGPEAFLSSAVLIYFGAGAFYLAAEFLAVAGGISVLAIATTALLIFALCKRPSFVKNFLLMRYGDRNFLLGAIRHDVAEFRFAYDRVKNDKSFVFQAIKANSLFLQTYSSHIRNLFQADVEKICREGVSPDDDRAFVKDLAKIHSIFDRQIQEDFMFRMAEIQEPLAGVSQDILESVLDRALDEEKEVPFLRALQAGARMIYWNGRRKDFAVKKCVEWRLVAGIDELARKGICLKKNARSHGNEKNMFFKKACSLGYDDVAVRIAAYVYPSIEDEGKAFLSSLSHDHLMDEIFTTKNRALEDYLLHPLTKEDLLGSFEERLERATCSGDKTIILDQVSSFFEIRPEHYSTGYTLTKPLPQPQKEIPLAHLVELLDKLYAGESKRLVETYCSKMHLSFSDLKNKLKTFVDDFEKKKVHGGQDLFFDEGKLRFQRIMCELDRRNDPEDSWYMLKDCIETAELCVGGYDEVLRTHDQHLGICVKRELTAKEKIEVDLAQFRTDCLKQASVDQNPRVTRNMQSHQYNQAFIDLSERFGVIGTEDHVHQDPFVPEGYNKEAVEEIFQKEIYTPAAIVKRLSESLEDSLEMQKSFFELMAEKSGWEFDGKSEAQIFTELGRMRRGQRHKLQKKLQAMKLTTVWEQAKETDFKKKADEIEKELRKIFADEWMNGHLADYYDQKGKFKIPEKLMFVLFDLLVEVKIAKIKDRNS